MESGVALPRARDGRVPQREFAALYQPRDGVLGHPVPPWRVPGSDARAIAASPSRAGSRSRAPRTLRRVGPGVLLAVAVAVVSIAISGVETRLFGSPVI